MKEIHYSPVYQIRNTLQEAGVDVSVTTDAEAKTAQDQKHAPAALICKT